MRDLKNVNLYNSSSFLEGLVPNLNGTSLYWLSSHEMAAFATKTKTNVSVVKELEVLKQLASQGSVICINNLRYFQPVLLDQFDSRTYRHYPSLKEAFDLIKSFVPKYEFFVLGDIGIAFPSNPLA